MAILRWQFHPIYYAGEFGHLSGQRQNLRPISGFHLTILDADDLLVFGEDNRSRKWQARLPYQSGSGWTTIWQGDFDRNHRNDFLLATHFPGNGRCIDQVTLSFLMIDSEGVPNPWMVQTRLVKNASFSSFPAILTNLPGREHASLAVVTCAYSEDNVGGELTSFSGLYEAREAAWRRINADLLWPTLSAIFSVNYLSPGSSNRLLRSPAVQSDLTNVRKVQAERKAFIASVIRADPECGGINLGAVEQGQLMGAKRCSETQGKRILLSSGTVCYGWPTLVLDGFDGREITASTSKSIEGALLAALNKHLPVVLGGESISGRCSPTVIWAGG